MHTPTKQSVKHVASLLKQNEDFHNIIDSLGKMTIKAKDAIERKDIFTLGDTMNGAMEGLKALGLSTPTIEKLNQSALHNGALASKLTGGGMGGCVIALCYDKYTAEKVSAAWRDDFSINTWTLNLLGG